jgi:transposase
MSKQEELQGKTSAELLSVISYQQVKINNQTQFISQLQEYIRLLKHGKFGNSSERYIDDALQGRLFDEADLSTEQVDEIEVVEEQILVGSHARAKKPGGRKSFPAHLPRKQVFYDLGAEEKHCGCGCELTAIGEEKTEQLEIIPAQCFVIEHIQKKYACKACEETIKTAEKPKQPIPRGVAGPGLLAHVLTEKFEFHLPLYRQEKRLQRIGVDIPRATLSHWVIKCSELLQPLVNLLEDEVREYSVAYADETTVQVLKEPNKKAQSKSYIWVYSGGPPERFSHVCHYHPGRQHAHAIEFFEGYSGYLHCDGYQAYDTLCRINKSVKQVGCWYHVRRKFVEAAKASKKPARRSGLSSKFKSYPRSKVTVIARCMTSRSDKPIVKRKRQLFWRSSRLSF